MHFLFSAVDIAVAALAYSVTLLSAMQMPITGGKFMILVSLKKNAVNLF